MTKRRDGIAPDDYEMWDAAYVLGALTEDDRREFESHLADCSSCRQSVRSRRTACVSVFVMALRSTTSRC